jgi:excisionase family DNA binding protein
MEDLHVTVVESWLSVDEIAKHLGISKETVYRWLDRGKIPAHRVGKLWKFQISEVNEWVRQGGAQDAAKSKTQEE